MNDKLNVKVGDKVIYNGGGIYGRRKITTVTKVTPTGRIRVDCSNSQFTPDGSQMGDTGYCGSARLEEATEEAIRDIEQGEVIDRCVDKMENVSKLTYEQAVKILEILGE